MKTILSILFIVMFGISAFAAPQTNNNDKDKGKKKKARTAASAQAEAATEEAADESFAAVPADKDMTVKVFDIKGKVVMEKKVKIESLFTKNYTMEELPKGSVFVMFHESTAYFFKEL